MLVPRPPIKTVTTKRVEFVPPNGATPEGTQAGEEFDAVCTFRVKDNGQICLIQLGDVQMPGYSDSPMAHKPEYQAPSSDGGY